MAKATIAITIRTAATAITIQAAVLIGMILPDVLGGARRRVALAHL
jgi:hypothetical protein